MPDAGRLTPRAVIAEAPLALSLEATLDGSGHRGALHQRHDAAHPPA
jgi:hypothetical protein